MVSEVTLSPEAVASDLRPVLLRLARELRKETEQLGITARQATLLWLVKRCSMLHGVPRPFSGAGVDAGSGTSWIRRAWRIL